jgi:hypothetical protein
VAADDPNLVTAFMNAHAAGDTAAAGVLAAEIQRQRLRRPLRHRLPLRRPRRQLSAVR